MDWLMFLWTVRVGFQDPKLTISAMKTMDKIGLDMWRARTTNKSFAKVVWNNNDIPWVVAISITLLSARLDISWRLLPTPFLCVCCRQLSWKISCVSRIPRCASTTSTTNVDLPPCACKGGPWNIGGRCWQDEFFPRFTGGGGFKYWILFNFHPKPWGNDQIWLNCFRGWNHQLLQLETWFAWTTNLAKFLRYAISLGHGPSIALCM